MAVNKKKIRKISCEEAIKRLFVYIDDYLKGNSKDEFENHLNVCRDCFEKAKFQRQFKSRMKRLKSEVPSQFLRKRIHKILQTT